MKIGEVWELNWEARDLWLQKARIEKLYSESWNGKMAERIVIAPIEEPHPENWIKDLPRTIFLNNYRKVYEDR